ncbi:MAG TPA: hypothetical protein ENN84_11725 [Candidatus Marinimicrobia bacterium]|nr:hypothetical protein [Candidatus Neomarinimicrobiota bacterium]
MTLWHKTLKPRFVQFPRWKQIILSCSELNRAHNICSFPQEYKEALELIDFSNDSGSVWKGRCKEFLRARKFIAEMYLSEPQETKVLQKCLIALDKEAFKLLYSHNQD